MHLSAPQALTVPEGRAAAPNANLVLNVDDDPAKRYLRTRLLSRAGYEVVEASTGAEALALARERQPALVLLDVLLPDVNGLAICSQLRADPLTQAIPVLAISSHFNEPEFAAGIEGDCDAYLAEPVPPPVLLASVRSLVRLRAATADVERELARRRKAEEELRTSQARLELALDIAGLEVWEYDIEADRVHASGRTASAFGFEQAPLTRGEWVERIHPGDRDRVREDNDWAINGGAVEDTEYRVLHPDGVRWIKSRSRCLRSPEGRPERLIGVTSDITGPKQAERALRESEMRYRTLFDSIDEGFCIIEVLFDDEGKALDYRFLETNEAFVKQTGLANAAGRRMRELAEKHEEYWFETYGEVARTGRPVRFQNRAEEFHRWYDVYAFPFGAPERRQVGILFRDVSERKEAEAARDNLLERFRTQTAFLEKLVANIPLGVAVVDAATGRYTLANTAYERLAGVSAGGKTIAEVLPPGALAVVRRDIETLLERRRPLCFREREVDFGPGRERTWWYADYIPLLGRDGQVESILGIFQEITEFVVARDRISLLAAEAEARARDAERGQQTLLALMEHIPEGITIADAPDVTIRMVSRHGAEIAGRPREALEGLAAERHTAPAWDLVHLDGVTPVRPDDLPLTRATRHGEAIAGEELIMRRPDGSAVPILCNAGPIRDREGNITGGVIAWRDISARKDWERRLAEIQKRESIAVLAGGIAHDFNNLLTTVLGNASILEDSIPRGGPDRFALDAIMKAAERAASLTSQMLAYAGKGRFEIRQVNLTEAVRQMMPLLRPAVPASIRIDLELAAHLPPVQADPGQMDQIILNLVTNAAEALTADRSGAAIVIATGVHEVSGALRVFLEVRDNGPGIPPDVLDRVFEPFFTTKFTGRGLGLAAVEGIVHGHGGTIEVDTAPERGSAFRILLPAHAERARRRTVLVVDDEEVVCDIVRATLERHGYTVLAARDGLQAIEIARTHAGKISLTLLDMVMPGLSGEETLRELKRIDPRTPVVVSTGYSQTEAQRRFLNEPVAGFLPKPYMPAALLEKVRAVCAGE